MANVLQTNKVDAQCDKLATELSWQRFASKVTNYCQLPHLHLAYPTCIWCLRWKWSRWSFAEIFRFRKLESLRYHAALFAWSHV